MVLLNLDAGEHDDEPDLLWGLADVLCVACGGHAGDTASMTRVVKFCAERRAAGHVGPRLGAHPSYPDRPSFGRVSRAPSSAAELRAIVESIREQCRALVAIAEAHRIPVEYVKPHGALYHDANRDHALAEGIVEATGDVLGFTVQRVIGPPRGVFAEVAAARSTYLREAFADRRTRPDGTLVPRSEPDALVVEPAAAAARARELVASGEADTICCHADTPGSLAIVSAVRAVLTP